MAKVVRSDPAEATTEMQSSVLLHGKSPTDTSASLDAATPGPGAAGTSAEAAAGSSGTATPDEPATSSVRRKTFYEKLFNSEEMRLIAALSHHPSPEDELWLQRVLNHRLLTLIPRDNLAPITDLKDDEHKFLDDLAQLVRLLSGGAARVAALLRELRAVGRGDLEKAPDAVKAAAQELRVSLAGQEQA